MLQGQYVTKEPNAQDTRERRLLRPILSLHARTGGHDQGKGEAFGKHHRLRPRAHRRPPNHVRPTRSSGGDAGSRYEEPEASLPPGVHPPSARPPVSDPSGATSHNWKVRKTLTAGLS